MTAHAAHVRSFDTSMQTRATMAAARRRSRTVRLVRFGLIGALAGLTLAVAGYATRHAVGSEQIARSTNDVVRERMINPRFTGRDSAGDPFVITAEAAQRTPEDAARTSLEQPRLRFFGADGPGSIVIAESGLYDRVNRTLDLRGDVRFETANGYKFRTSTARVFVDQNRIFGAEQIIGEGPLGRITARSFEVTNGGAVVAFRGSVRARLTQQPKLVKDLRSSENEATEDVAPEAAATQEEPIP